MTKKFEKIKNILKRAKDCWLNKEVKIEECISNLSEAITIMGMLPSFGDKVLLPRHLLEAYYLRALFEQKTNPESERIAEDLKAALLLWPNDETLPTIMFYNIIDLLQLKGSMEDVYSLLSNSFKQQKSMSSMDWFNALWMARRLNHPLCCSPISESLISHLSKQLYERSSILFKSAGDERYFVEKISKDEDPPSYAFALGYAHLERSRQEASTGDVDEALMQALKSHEHFSRIASETQEIIFKGVEVCLVENRDIEFKENYITSWKVIQGYLECLLQLGVMYERMGHAFDAQHFLLKGLDICRSFHFPLLYLFFSIHIEKLHARGFNDVELPGAMEFFENVKGLWGCPKCHSLIRSTLYGDRAEFQKLKSNTKARNSYTEAVKEIKSSLWENNVSSEAFQTSHFSRSKSLHDLVNFKWECLRRQLAIELHIGLGECYSGEDEEGKVLLQNISLLAGGNPFSHTQKSIDQDFFGNFVAIESTGDMFAIQRAEVIHTICCYCLKYYQSDFVRNSFGFLDNFGKIASYLKVAFVLSRGVPHILQKVSTLLCVMYVISCSTKNRSLSSISDGLKESIWSAYFHQISIGTNLTNKFHWELTEIFKGPHVAKSSSIFDSVGYIPKNTKDLTEHVKIFMVGLSSVTITCLSILEKKYVAILLKCLPRSDLLPEHTNAMMLVSRLDFETDPFTMIQPIPKGCEVGDLLTRLSNIVRAITIPIEAENPSSHHDNMLNFHHEEKSRNGTLKAWLSELEESWFGPWKCLFQGDLNGPIMDSVLETLLEDLGPISASVDNIKSLLKIILGGYQFFEVPAELKIGLRTKNGCCFMARKGYYDALCHMLTKKNHIFEEAFGKAFNSMKDMQDLARKPIMFVFDSQLQMIPWENIPVGRDQEIYRMPSVSSIFTVLEYHKKLNTKEQLGRNLVTCPSMDPKEAFYIMNPVEDPNSKFEDLEALTVTEDLKGFKDCRPTDEELAYNIKKHDLFMLFGHIWVWPVWKHMNSTYTEKESRAVVMLMGCETAKLELQGRYIPECYPYSYLWVGCPAVFANLWKVTDIEIDLLGAELYEQWVLERSKDGDRHGIAAFMPEARKACCYCFLTGASTVCYGIPTKICKKDNILSSQLPSKRKHSEFNS